MKQQILGDNFEVASTIFSRARGLMFRTKIIPLFFIFPEPGIYSIHSLFVFNSFEAIYLDKDWKVIDIFKIKPFTLLIKNSVPALYLLEVPEAWARTKKLKKGMILYKHPNTIKRKHKR